MDDLRDLIDWAAIERQLAVVSCSAKGEPAWPPLSASEEDGEARWVKHKGRAAVHGFKAHVGADADTALVEEVAIHPGQCQ